MTFEGRIRAAYPAMSKSFLRLADFILDNYIEASFMTATELAHTVNVDTTTVVRFAQQLGYSGYPPLLREIREKVKTQLLVESGENLAIRSAQDVLRHTMLSIREVVGNAHMLVDVQALESLTARIGLARRVILLPDTLAQPAAHTLANLLERGGFAVSMAQHSVAALAQAVCLATPNDLIVALEVIGETPYIARALTEAQKMDIPTAAIVAAASFASARATDLVIATQTQPAEPLRMVLVDAVLFGLGQMIRWKYAGRYQGVDEAIADISARIRSAGE